MRLVLEAQPATRRPLIAWTVVVLVAAGIVLPLLVLGTGWMSARSERAERLADVEHLQARIEVLSRDLDARPIPVDRAGLDRVRDPAEAAAAFEQQIAAFEANLAAAGIRFDDPVAMTTGPYGPDARIVTADLAFTGPADLVLTALAAPDMAAYQVLALDLLTLPGAARGQMRARITLGLALPGEDAE